MAAVHSFPRTLSGDPSSHHLQNFPGKTFRSPRGEPPGCTCWETKAQTEGRCLLWVTQQGCGRARMGPSLLPLSPRSPTSLISPWAQLPLPHDPQYEPWDRSSCLPRIGRQRGLVPHLQALTCELPWAPGPWEVGRQPPSCSAAAGLSSPSFPSPSVCCTAASTGGTPSPPAVMTQCASLQLLGR